MFKLLYFFIWLLKKSRSLSALSCRLTQLTAKSKYPIHPKHLINKEEGWYLRNIEANDLVLDLGCGGGQHSIRVAGKCKKIIGVDYSQRQLEIAKNSARDKKIKNIKFIKLDLERKLPFKNNSFNKILCLDVLEHLNKRKQLLMEIKRVLKPKGIFFTSLPHKNTSWKKIQRKVGLNSYTDPDHKVEYSLNEIKKLFSKTGFKILKVKPIVFDTPLAGLIDLIGGFSLNLYKKLSFWKRKKAEENPEESIGFRIMAEHVKAK